MLALSVGFNENPGPGVCPGVKEQSVDLEFERNSHVDYFDAESIVKMNVGDSTHNEDGTCKDVKPLIKRVHYKFQDGKYLAVEPKS